MIPEVSQPIGQNEQTFLKKENKRKKY